MMLHQSAMRKLAVLDISTGQILGLVRHIIFDHENQSLAGIGFSAWVWNSRKYITREAIRGIGDHALTIDSFESAKTLREQTALLRLIKANIPLLGAQVITTGGRLLGTVEDYTLAPMDYTLAEILLSGGLAQDLFRGYGRVPAQSILAIGRDAVVVHNDALSRNMAINQPKARPPLANVRYLRRVDEVLGGKHSPKGHGNQAAQSHSMFAQFLRQGKVWLDKATSQGRPPHPD